jgi:phasin family protein
MYTDLLKTFSEQNEKFLSPVLKFNQLVAQNIEQLASIQVNAVQNFSNTSVAQVKAAADIKDAKSLVDFNASQVNVLNNISQQMIEDGQKLSQLGQEFKDNLEELTKENFKAAQPSA